MQSLSYSCYEGSDSTTTGLATHQSLRSSESVSVSDSYLYSLYEIRDGINLGKVVQNANISKLSGDFGKSSQ